jgi:hypothetical protein
MARWLSLSNSDRLKGPDTAILRRDNAGAHPGDFRLWNVIHFGISFVYFDEPGPPA